MSESDQHEESLIETWAGVQQKVLGELLELVKGMESPSRAVTWNETIKAWQIAVQETLDVQASWVRDWTRRVPVTSGSPTELRKNVQQAQALLLRWTEAQQQLWQGWFRLVKQLEPLPDADPQARDHLIQTLRESGQAMFEAQAEWARRCMAD